MIVAGGALNTPQLLMLSGIGDTDELRRLDIAAVQHLPGVGANLQDHMIVSLVHRRIGPEGALHRMLRIDRLLPAILAAWAFGKGPATQLPAGVNAILRSQPNLDAPDLQIIFGAGAVEAKPWIPGISDWKDIFYLRPVGSHPLSRGRVWLDSADPREKPRIDPNYLSTPTTYPFCAAASVWSARSCGSPPWTASAARN